MRFVFLDLDGTLTDSAPGILNSISHALEKVSLDHAVALYRELYTYVGWSENSLYDGVLEQLSILTGQGYKLFIATPTHYSYAKKITAYFGTSDFMTYEFGSELDYKRSDQTSLLTHFLGVAGVLAESSLMIGDRDYDNLGAKNSRIKVVGANYGYGENTELIEADADALIPDFSELSSTVTSYLPLKDSYNGQD